MTEEITFTAELSIDTYDGPFIATQKGAVPNEIVRVNALYHMLESLGVPWDGEAPDGDNVRITFIEGKRIIIEPVGAKQ